MILKIIITVWGIFLFDSKYMYYILHQLQILEQIILKYSKNAQKRV